MINPVDAMVANGRELLGPSAVGAAVYAPFRPASLFMENPP